MSQWIERVSKKSRDCARCSGFIQRGEMYYERNSSGKPSAYCLACGIKLSEPAPIAKRETPRKRQRRPFEPLLGPGHIVHGLGRMQG